MLKLIYNLAWVRNGLSLVCIPSKGIRRGIFGCPLYCAAAAAATNRARELERVNIIIILYFKARCSKCNILEFYSNSSKLNVGLI